MDFKRKIGAVAITALAAAGIAVVATQGSAQAAHSLQASADKPLVWGCVNPSTAGLVGGRFYIYEGDDASAPFNRYPGCASWAKRVNWAEGNGAPGADAAVTEQSSQVTTVTDWPESSGWALDAFSRTAVVTRQNQVDASKCGSAAQQCYFYTESLSDTGYFDAINGQPAPNTGIGGTISGAPHGTMVGGGKVEFYASSNKPNGALVPSNQNGHGTFGTTDWAKQFFPAGTQFGAFNFSTYKWVYSVCAAQTWVDGINPGDDGQGASDGNITAGCTS